MHGLNSSERKLILPLSLDPILQRVVAQIPVSENHFNIEYCVLEALM